MSENEEDILSVVASSWTDVYNAEKTDGCETVDEMEGDWEVIYEVGDSDEPPQDEPSFEASRLITEGEGLEPEIGELGDQSRSEQSIDQQRPVEHLDGLTVTVGPNSLIRTVKASRLTSDLRLKSRYKTPAGTSGDKEEPTNQAMFHVLVPTDNKLPRGITSYERLPAELLPANTQVC